MTSESAAPKTPSGELVAATYAALCQRRLGLETLLWQVPAIGFTGQAFLLNIALSSGNREGARQALTRFR